MKKIMFNDRFGLTEAVLSGRKTQTRRMCRHQSPVESHVIVFPLFCAKDYDEQGNCKSPLSGAFGWRNEKGNFTGWNIPAYKVGEVVAIAQNYKDAGYKPNMLQTAIINGNIGDYPISQLPGWKNKMFTYPSMMPHHIRITGVRVERLQDISDEDCIREGIDDLPYSGYPDLKQFAFYDTAIKTNEGKGWYRSYDTPREAYASLIDRISGRGTWASNPLVFVYDFELVD